MAFRVISLVSECSTLYHNKHKRKLMCAIFLWCSAWLIKVFWVLTCIRSKPLQYIVCMKTFASDKPFKFIDFLGLQAWYPFLSDGDMQSKLLPAKNYGLRGQGWETQLPVCDEDLEAAMASKSCWPKCFPLNFVAISLKGSFLAPLKITKKVWEIPMVMLHVRIWSKN